MKKRIVEALDRVLDQSMTVEQEISEKYPALPDCEIGYPNYGSNVELDNCMGYLDRYNWLLVSLLFTTRNEMITAEQARERLLAIKPVPVRYGDSEDAILAADTLQYVQQRIASLQKELVS